MRRHRVHGFRRPSLRTLCMVIASTLAGCGAQTEPGTEPATSDVPVAVTPFSVTYGPWTVDTVPALPRGPEGSWDSGLVDPGAMTVHMGRFHMLYNGIPNWPHPLSVGWATSTDGRVWERQIDAPVFAPDPVPYGGWTVRATSVLVEDDQWILYFVVGGEGQLEGVVGRATAPGPDGPWTVDPTPVFEPGGPGAWDARAIGHAKVMPDAGGYVMYYTGWGEGPTRIGRAVSADGIAWTRDGGPVLEPPIGEAATEDFQVSDPTVTRTGDGRWLMVHRISRRSGHVAIAVAESDDGIRWTIDPAGPVTGLGADSPLGMIFYNNMLATHTHQLVYFEGESRGGTDVWAAVRTVTLDPGS